MIHPVKIIWPAVFKPRQALPTSPLRYSVGFECSNKTFIDQGVFPNSKNIYNASSLYAPRIMVYDGKYDLFVKTLNIADARNIPRDMLLKNMEVYLMVCFLEHKHLGETRKVLGLDRVSLDAEELYKRATE